MTERSPLELWLVRHGRTSWNAARRLLGWTDVPLDADGEAQARALGHRLADQSFTSCHSSDLTRATQTARLAYGEARADPRLRELSFGALEGATLDELEAAVRDALVSFRGFSAPRGESVQDLEHRVLSFLDDLPAGRHLVFTHGGVIRLLLDKLGARPHVPPATVAVLDWAGQRVLAVHHLIEATPAPPSGDGRLAGGPSP